MQKNKYKKGGALLLVMTGIFAASNMINNSMTSNSVTSNSTGNNSISGISLMKIFAGKVFIRKASALKRISAHFPHRYLTASMTLEACFVLPFFLFAFLNVISIMEIYRLQGNMSLAMHETAKQMAVYGYEYKEAGGDLQALTCIYAAGKVRAKLGKAYLDNAPIAGGASSISWLRSSVMQENDCIDLVAEYRITPPAAVIGYSVHIMYNRMRTRAWTGYDNACSGIGDGTGEEIVYITPDGVAYHGTRGCSYLKLSISAVDSNFLEKQRNESGEKYYACEECTRSEAECSFNTVYITNYGNRYHMTLGCSKLKRTILAVPISEAGDRRPCGKCVK